MKIFRIALICLWAIVLITGGTINSQNLVRWKNVGTLELGSMQDSSGTTKDTLIYMFPRSGSQRYADTDGNLHFNIKTNNFTSGAVANTDSFTFAYQCLSYADDNFCTDSNTVTKNVTQDIADGTIRPGGTNFPLFTNLDWDSGSTYEYPNLTSVLYPYGPCMGLLLIGEYTTVDDSDSVSIEILFEQQ